MKVLLWIASVLVLGLPVRAELRESPKTAGGESPKPAAKRTVDEAKQKAEAARNKAAAELAAKKKAKNPAAVKASPESAFGSAARRAILAQRASLKGKVTAKNPSRAKS